MTGLEKLLGASLRYQEYFRNSDLKPFIPHELDDTITWKVGHGGQDAGCYAILSENHDVLYVGKASGRTNDRINAALKDLRKWVSVAPKYVQVIEVIDSIEAASFEEFLIRELNPPLNKTFTSNTLLSE